MNKEIIKIIEKLIKQTEGLDKDFEKQIKGLDILAKEREFVDKIGEDNLIEVFKTLDACRYCLLEVKDRLTEIKKNN